MSAPHDAPLPPLDAPESGKGMILIAAALGLLAIVGVGVTIFFAIQPLKPRVIFGDAHVGQKLTGALVPQKAYAPTSQYVEPGADSDTIALDLSGPDAPASDRPSGLSEEAIQRVMYGHQMDLLNCYAAGLDINEELAGRVDFHFRVAGDGHVAMVKLTQSGLRDKPTEDCLVNVSRQWRFPKTDSGQLARFDTHFTFASQ